MFLGSYAIAVSVMRNVELGAWKYTLPDWIPNENAVPGGVNSLIWKILGAFTVATGLFGVIGLACSQARGFIIIHIIVASIDVLLFIAALCGYLYEFIAHGSRAEFRNLCIAVSIMEVLLIIDLAAANRCNASLKSRLDRMVSEVSANPRRSGKKGKGKEPQRAEDDSRLAASAVPWTHGQATGPGDSELGDMNTIDRTNKAASRINFAGWDQDVAQPAATPTGLTPTGLTPTGSVNNLAYSQGQPGAVYVDPAYQQSAQQLMQQPSPQQYEGPIQSQSDLNQPQQQYYQAPYVDPQYQASQTTPLSGTPPGSARFSEGGYYPSGIIPTQYPSGVPPGFNPQAPYGATPSPHDSYNPQLFNGPGLGWWPAPAQSDFSTNTSSALFYPPPPGSGYDPHTSLGWWTSQYPAQYAAPGQEMYAAGAAGAAGVAGAAAASEVSVQGSSAAGQRLSDPHAVRPARKLPPIPVSEGGEPTQPPAVKRSVSPRQQQQQQPSTRTPSPPNSISNPGSSVGAAHGSAPASDVSQHNTSASNTDSPKMQPRPNTFGHLDDFRSSLGSEGLQTLERAIKGIDGSGRIGDESGGEGGGLRPGSVGAHGRNVSTDESVQGDGMEVVRGKSRRAPGPVDEIRL
ncbi:hypothetical protein HDV00_000074 [Rhizophlyctis rosea]|nr:hypothetical protein HDV00_000074 [Rhizophlyctis rosea]